LAGKNKRLKVAGINNFNLPARCSEWRHFSLSRLHQEAVSLRERRSKKKT